MARVLNPMMSTDAKGTTSGITFSKWRGIKTARRQGISTRRVRNLQPTNRTYIGYLSRTWQNVSAADRELWKTWAQNHPKADGFGGVFQMSGINAYVSLNKIRLDRNGAAVLSVQPPIEDLDKTVQSFSAVQGAASGKIELTWATLGVGGAADFIEIGIAGPFASSGKFEVEGKYKTLTAVAGNIALYSSTGLQPGAWYWHRIRYVGADGQVSGYLVSQAQAKI